MKASLHHHQRERERRSLVASTSPSTCFLPSFLFFFCRFCRGSSIFRRLKTALVPQTFAILPAVLCLETHTLSVDTVHVLVDCPYLLLLRCRGGGALSHSLYSRLVTKKKEKKGQIEENNSNKKKGYFIRAVEFIRRRQYRRPVELGSKSIIIALALLRRRQKKRRSASFSIHPSIHAKLNPHRPLCVASVPPAKEKEKKRIKQKYTVTTDDACNNSNYTGL